MPTLNSLLAKFGTQKTPNLKGGQTLKQLVATYENIFFAWTPKGLVAATNLSQNAEKSELIYDFHTLLHLTVIPFGQIQQLIVNRIGTLLALVCDKFCYVVEIPRILRLFQSKSELEPEYLCKCHNLDLNLSGSDRQFLKVRWHPGSLNACHLTTLTSDNIIRIYGVEKIGCKLVQLIRLDQKNDVTFGEKMHGSTLNMLSSIGESAVSFDFGTPIDRSKIPLYPLYVLYGNGDVYSILTDSVEFKKISVRGPLTVTPPAEDNYGMDSCDLLVLGSSKRPQAVNILVIATSYGNLYHCVITPEVTGDLDGVKFSLHVYETAELEFSLATIDFVTKKFKEDSISSQVALHKDEFSSDTYYCGHGSGVHSVTLPWLHDFESMNAEITEQQEGDIDYMAGYDKACLVEYKLCTCPSQSETFLPVLGLVPIFRNPSNRLLLCLMHDFTTQIVKLHSGVPYTRLSDENFASKMNRSREISSFTPKNATFIEQISGMLKRDSSLPLLKVQRDKSNVSEMECCELLLRTVDIANAEYLKKINQALAVCLQRTETLSQLCRKQKVDAKGLVTQFASKLAPGQENLMRKMENLQANQAELHEKLNCVNNYLSEKRDCLSQAEENAHRDLKFKRTQVDLLADKLEKIKQAVESHFNLFTKSRPDSNIGCNKIYGGIEINQLVNDQDRQIDGLLCELKLLTVD